jgi:hypothetical protein
MAKKTVARRQSATPRLARAPEAKAPAAPSKRPSCGSRPARAARGSKKAASSLPANPAVEALKPSTKPATKSTRAAAERAFVKGLMARGEVAESGAPLEAGMTHEGVGRKGTRTPQVTRRRFSLR